MHGNTGTLSFRSLIFGAIAILATTGILLWTLGRPAFWKKEESLSAGAHGRIRASHNPGALTSESCKSCHADIFEEWRESHHAHANRMLDPGRDREAFDPAQRLKSGKVDSLFHMVRGQPEIFTRDSPGPPQAFHPDMVLAYTPLIQFLIPFPGGRWQVTETAWDPARKDWFNVYGSHGRNPGEWGSWSGRGMNWNSNCAACHMTNFQKNYDIASDSYRSTWDEMAIGCTQCHGVGRDHITSPPPPGSGHKADAALAQETCMSCHSRREELTMKFKPGTRFADHYRLALPSQRGLYHPDGQALDEVFVSGSFLMSRMGSTGGIRCLDCHNPHTGRTILPVSNNALCMSCHSAPGQNNAPAIDPVAHSHHTAESTGNRCVDCHMTFTPFMERDLRRDHGMHSPDPLLTRELGIPNACNKCHTDKPVDWAIEWTDKWYGSKLDRRQRVRARLVARVHADDPSATPDLLRFLAEEDIPAWRAAIAGMLGERLADDGVRPALRTLLEDADSMVRTAAAQALGNDEQERALLRPLLDDPVREVRLAAQWAMGPEIHRDAKGWAELAEWLKVSSDQPAGAARQGQFAFGEGHDADAFAWYQRAIAWDPLSVPLFQDLATMKNMRGDSAGSLQTLLEGIKANPDNADLHFMAALVEAERGDETAAERLFRATIAKDPSMARAWYNLGLLLSQRSQFAEAVECLRKAGSLDPGSPDYPYARATLHLRMGDPTAAREAASVALKAAPGHPPSRALLQSLPSR